MKFRFINKRKKEVNWKTNQINELAKNLPSIFDVLLEKAKNENVDRKEYEN